MEGRCIQGGRGKRNITRDGHESLRKAKALYKTRAPGIETVFGIITTALGIRRFSVPRLNKVRIGTDADSCAMVAEAPLN